MKVTVIPNGISELSAISKGLLQRLDYLEISRRVKTIQTSALLVSARILRDQETYCHLDSRGKPSVKADVKNLHNDNYNISSNSGQKTKPCDD